MHIQRLDLSVVLMNLFKIRLWFKTYIRECNKQFWCTQIASLKVFFEMGFALYAGFGGYLSHTVQGRWAILVSKGACHQAR